MEPTPVGKRLWKERKAKGWTLAQLSNRCHLFPQTISAIETGASENPRTATVLTIGQALDIPAEELLALLDPAAPRQEVPA